MGRAVVPRGCGAAGGADLTSGSPRVQTASGHTIEISDHDGEEKILIRHAKDAFVSIDEHGSVLLSNPHGSHLHLDAAQGTTTLVQEDGNFLTMGKKGTSIVNPDGTMIDLTGDTVNVAAKKVIVQSPSVALGSEQASRRSWGPRSRCCGNCCRNTRT